MAAGSSTFSAVGSHDDPLVRPPQPYEWELLTVSSSTLLSSSNHGLGFGLPPLSTSHLLPHPSLETEGSRRESNFDAEKGFGFGDSDGSSLPLDVSQIASTSSVEPFTEGWKPQFRIAGAALQENYYAPDPFASSAASNTRISLEPFPNMEHSFIKESSAATEKGAPKSEGKQASFASTDTSRPVESSHVVGDDDQLLSAYGQLKEGTQTASEVSNAIRKAESRKVLDEQGKCTRQNGHGKFNGRSYLAWSVAVTTTLLGVFLISYCLQTDHKELPSTDECPVDAGYRHGVKEAVLRRWKMAVT